MFLSGQLSDEAKGTRLPLPGSALPMSVQADLRCRYETAGTYIVALFVVRGAGSNPKACGQEGVISEQSTVQQPHLPYESP